MAKIVSVKLVRVDRTSSKVTSVTCDNYYNARLAKRISEVKGVILHLFVGLGVAFFVLI